MLKPRPSPIKLTCGKPYADIGDDDFVACEWRCTRNVAGAMFRNRRHPRQTIIVHPSSKRSGRWQASEFEGSKPVGDYERGSCSEVLYAAVHPARDWKLVEAVPSSAVSRRR